MHVKKYVYALTRLSKVGGTYYLRYFRYVYLLTGYQPPEVLLSKLLAACGFLPSAERALLCPLLTSQIHTYLL